MLLCQERTSKLTHLSVKGGGEVPEWITTVRLVTYAIYFVIGLTGAVTKDLYDVLMERIIKIQIQKVVLGGIVTAAIMPFVESLLTSRLNPEAFLALGFLCGVISFELFGKISSISGIKDIIRDAVEVREIMKDRRANREGELEGDVDRSPRATDVDSESNSGSSEDDVGPHE